MKAIAQFTALKNYIKLQANKDTAVIDNNVFKLHYRITFLILITGTLVLSAQHFIGSHIECTVDQNLGNSIAAIESYCFSTSTFTVAKYMNKTAVDLGHVPHPGVGPLIKGDKVTYHAYYQWVPFFLFFQAIMFYMPHYMWKKVEDDRLKTLVVGLRTASLLLHNDDVKTSSYSILPSRKARDEQMQLIRKAFLDRIHMNRPWTYYLMFYEVLNFINVFIQIFITNIFLGGIFLNLGFTVFEFESSLKMDLLDTVFPKVTKCSFRKFGASGTIQLIDALCVMSWNIVNEKIFFFLWFWYAILIIASTLGIIWRILTIILHARSKAFNRFIFSWACPGKYNPWDVLRVTHECYYGDWLFLYYIAKNVDNSVFKELLEQLAYDMEYRRLERDNDDFPASIKEPLNKIS